MYCRNCGTQCPDNAMFCSGCGATLAPQPQQAQQPQYRDPGKSVTFVEAVTLFFTRYADFKGRSRRSEYWWASLFTFLGSMILTAIVPEAATIWSLAILIPGIALCVRRLHDIGKSGWFYLIGLIPVVGFILLLIWFCKDSTGDNQWGKSPKY